MRVRSISSQPNEPLLCLLLFLVVLAVFLPSVRNDFVNYDDPAYVTANDHVKGGLKWEGLWWAFTSTEESNWHPVTWLSHMLDCRLFGLRSWGHHLTSVLFHTLNTVMLFWLLRSLTGALWQSLVIALLFGVHPLRVQSVVWIAERKDVLSACFFMSALLAWIRPKIQGPNFRAQAPTSGDGAVDSTGHGPNFATHSAASVPGSLRGLCSRWYWLTLLLFALGLMSKPSVVTLPLVLLLLDYWPLRRLQDARSVRLPLDTQAPGHRSWQRVFWGLVLEKLPFFVLAAAASAITLWVQQSGGAIRSLERLPLTLRLEGALVSYGRYLLKFFYPVNLSVFYPYPAAWLLWQVLMALLALGAISVLVVILRRKHPYLFIGWLWYLITLLPMIGLVQAGAQSMADRYTYISLIGIAIMLVHGAYDLTCRWSWHRVLLAAVSVVLLATCAGLTRWQIGFWTDSETLFRRALAVTSDNPLARLNLGVALAEKGKPGAAAELQAALALVPDDPDLQRTVGRALVVTGHPAEAVGPLQASVVAEPDRADAQLLLGRALEGAGRLEEAIIHYREAARLDPQLADAQADLGVALFRKGDFEESAARFRETLKLRPTSSEAHDNLGLALSRSGRLDEALSEFGEALRLKPSSADVHNHLGLVLRQMHRLDEAIAQFQQALTLMPTNAEAQVNWGVVLYNQGRSDEAIAHFREALRLDPNHAQARKNLETLLARKRASGGP